MARTPHSVGWGGLALSLLLGVSNLAHAQGGPVANEQTRQETQGSLPEHVPKKPVARTRPGLPNCPVPPPLPPRSEDDGPVSWRDCADTPEMIRLKGGRFLMGEQSNVGTPYELPVHEVAVSEFSLSKYEITFDEFDACHADRGCLRKADDEGWGRGRRPVINVTWLDAQQYVAWLSKKTGRKYRLPSEAEWEYAARNGTSTRYGWGDGSIWVCARANVFDRTAFQVHPNWHWRADCDDGFAKTAPVGSFKPSAWGFHDLAGNVWEWVQDCWHSDYSNAPSDSKAWVHGGDCRKRVNRGGGWGNNPRSMRSATRDADDAESLSDAIGFRVARDP